MPVFSVGLVEPVQHEQMAGGVVGAQRDPVVIEPRLHELAPGVLTECIRAAELLPELSETVLAHG